MDGTFSRGDFAYDPDGNLYVCPGARAWRLGKIDTKLPPDEATFDLRQYAPQVPSVTSDLRGKP